MALRATAAAHTDCIPTTSAPAARLPPAVDRHGHCRGCCSAPGGHCTRAAAARGNSGRRCQPAGEACSASSNSSGRRRPPKLLLDALSSPDAAFFLLLEGLEGRDDLGARAGRGTGGREKQSGAGRVRRRKLAGGSVLNASMSRLTKHIRLCEPPRAAWGRGRRLTN